MVCYIFFKYKIPLSTNITKFIRSLFQIILSKYFQTSRKIVYLFEIKISVINMNDYNVFIINYFSVTAFHLRVESRSETLGS